MTLRALALLPLLALAACETDKTSTDDQVDSDETDVDTNDELPPLTVAADGDFSCLTPATTFDAVTWAAEQVPLLQPEIDVEVLVEDFEQETPVPGRKVSLWFDDVVEGDADTSGTVDDNGNVTLTAPSCTPLAYQTEELPGLDEAKDTFKSHQVLGTTQTDVLFQSVSIDTYRLIPTVLGLSVEPSKGIIAGSTYDCTRDASALSDDDTGKIGNIRVRLAKCPSADPDPATCTEAVTGTITKYFIDNFPDRDQPYTSDDGLWGVFNVPEGTFRVEAYGLIDGEEKIFGATLVTVAPDSINIGNIWAGYDDGVKYPASCLTIPMSL